MAEHLSDLSLDELAVGEAGPTAQEHLRGCPHCQDRLRQLESLRQRARAAPQFNHVLTRLKAQAPVPSRLPRWAWLFAPAATLCALLLVWGLQRPGADRLKGTPELGVVLADGSPAPRELSPGQLIAVTVGAAGHSQLLVLAADHEEVAVLWPPGATASAPAPRGANIPLAPAWEVTPGDVTLFAFFSERRVGAEEAVDAVRQAGGGTPAVEGAEVVTLGLDVASSP